MKYLNIFFYVYLLDENPFTKEGIEILAKGVSSSIKRFPHIKEKRKDLIQFEKRNEIYLFNYLRNEGINFSNDIESKEVAQKEAKILYDIIISNNSEKKLKASIIIYAKIILEQMN